jgi:hypothetical protein
VKFFRKMADHMFDGPIRFVNGIERVGAWDRIEIQRDPMPRGGLERGGLDSAIASGAGMEPSKCLLPVDALGGPAAHD